MRASKCMISFFFIFMISFLITSAQEAFNYQGLARDGEGEPLSNKEIAVQISIHSSGESGEVVYRERHYPITSERGLFSIRVGMGIHEFGSFENIDWGSTAHFIRTRLDPDGGSAYIDLGAAQLYSVPYALFAKNAAVSEDDSDDQYLVLSGTVLSIESGNSVDLSTIRDGVNDADADPTNEIQSLALSGNVLGLSNSNSVTLPSLTNTDDQQLSLSGSNLSIENGNSISLSSLINDADADPTNELQALTVSGNVLGISNSNTVTLPTFTDTDDQELTLSGTNLSIESGNTVNLNTLINDADADPSNELQTLTLYGNALGISGGNMVTLPYVLNNNPWETTVKGIQYEGGEYAKVFNINGSITLTPYQGWLHESPDGYTISRIDNVSNSGSISLFSYDSRTIDLWSDFDGAGKLTTYLDNDVLAEIDHYLKGGRFTLFYNNVPKVESTTSGDAGLLRTYGSTADKTNVLISWLNNYKDHGYVGIFGDNERIRIESYPCSHNSGVVRYFGSNGNYNVSVTHLNNYNNHGYFSVHDNLGVERAGVYVDKNGFGRVFSEFFDSFVSNPEKSGEKVVYSMLSGPEAALYLRGTSRLENGTASIDFPSHFRESIDKEGITVMITPLSGDSKGIAVVKKGREGFRVQELFEGSGNYEFDWEVKGLRFGSQLQKSYSGDFAPAHGSDIDMNGEKSKSDRK